MKLIFLGTAQDGGIPQAGCHCVHCRTMSRLAASVALIQGDGSVILLDATPDFRMQSRLWGDGRLAAIFLTHAHWGHYGGLMQLGKEGWSVKGLPLYASAKFIEHLQINAPFNSLFQMGNLVPQTITPGVATEFGLIGEVVSHRAEYTDTLAFRFALNGREVLYMPDVDAYDDRVDELVAQVDLAIIDGTFHDGDELPGRDLSKIPHPFIAGTTARASKQANKIIFTHFNHSNPMLDVDNPVRRKYEQSGFRFAEEGQVIE